MPAKLYTVNIKIELIKNGPIHPFDFFGLGQQVPYTYEKKHSWSRIPTLDLALKTHITNNTWQFTFYKKEMHLILFQKINAFLCI